MPTLGAVIIAAEYARNLRWVSFPDRQTEAWNEGSWKEGQREWDEAVNPEKG